MKTLKYGDHGPLAELLQTALDRAGYAVGAVDGIFGKRTRQGVMAFQRANGLTADGTAGPATQRALTPWYTGYAVHTAAAGDTLYKIAQMHGTTLRAIVEANPGLDPRNLQIGADVIVPLDFPVVPQGIRFGSTALAYSVRGLAARYPFLGVDEIGKSVMGKPIYALRFGRGETQVVYNGAHHANEWITAPLLLMFLENLCRAYVYGNGLAGYSGEALYQAVELTLVPMVNPDGVDLVTGELTEGSFYENARRMAAEYPDIPFPSGWKANIRGVDLNLQSPAGWETAREIKFAQGYTQPGPRDYVGTGPLEAPESREMYQLTQALSPALTLSYHTQGQVIYWKFGDDQPPCSQEIASSFGRVSGYAVEDTPYASGFAGYKDWFIQDFQRPGYTIEAGLGENPLPASQLPEIYRDNVGILTLGMALAGAEAPDCKENKN